MIFSKGEVNQRDNGLVEEKKWQIYEFYIMFIRFFFSKYKKPSWYQTKNIK